jgi:GDP-L-fucose synthase
LTELGGHGGIDLSSPQGDDRTQPVTIARPEAIFPLPGKRIWVAGHRGMVGSAIVRRLENTGAIVLTVGRDLVDLLKPVETEAYVANAAPDAIIVAAARVGGIVANDTEPAEFLFENLMIATNVIRAAHKAGTRRLVFLGSTCIYPRLAPQPIQESSLLTGPLEPTNEWYAVAKIAGIKLCQAYRIQHGCDFISAMPTNLFGPGDNYHPERSHVAAALIRKIHNAKIAGERTVTIWGTGSPRRDFLHVDDCADAIIHLLQVYSSGEIVNIWSGGDVTIRELAEVIADVAGWKGGFEYDHSKPDGTPRKLADVTRLESLGWRSQISLRDGLAQPYAWYVANSANPAIMQR